MNIEKPKMKITDGKKILEQRFECCCESYKQKQRKKIDRKKSEAKIKGKKTATEK